MATLAAHGAGSRWLGPTSSPIAGSQTAVYRLKVAEPKVADPKVAQTKVAK